MLRDIHRSFGEKSGNHIGESLILPGLTELVIL